MILELFVESVEVAIRISRHWKIFLGVLFLKTVSFGRLGGGGNYVVGRPSAGTGQFVIRFSGLFRGEVLLLTYFFRTVVNFSRHGSF